MAATSTERVKKHRANKANPPKPPKSPGALRTAKCRANKKLEQEAKKRSSTMETPPPKQEAPDALTSLLQLCTSPSMASNTPAQVKLLSACTSLKLRQEASKKWDDDLKETSKKWDDDMKAASKKWDDDMKEASKKWDDDMKGLVSILTQSTPESSKRRRSFDKKIPENINSEVFEATVQESKPPAQLTADQANEPWAGASWWTKPTASVVETVDSDDDYEPKAKRRRYN
jgi:hypothetical protein